MPQIFISHAEEDQDAASEIGGALERAGFSVWYHERNGRRPGLHYLEQVCLAIEECEAFVLVVSPDSIRSRNVTTEVLHAHDNEKNFVPILSGLTHAELKAQATPRWRLALANSTSIPVPPEGLSSILGIIEEGLKALGVNPASPAPSPEVAPPSYLGPARPAQSDEARLSVFAPETCRPGDAFLVQAWLHTDAQSEAVGESAMGDAADAQSRIAKDVDERLARGQMLLLKLDAKAFEVDRPEASVTWRGEPEHVYFTVTVPEEAKPSIRGARVSLHSGGVPLAHLKFGLRVEEKAKQQDAAQAPSPDAQPFTRFKKAYLCYAGRDRIEVRKRSQALSAAGLEIFDPVERFAPGEEWDAVVRRMIDEADIFHLFWSEAARNSEYVRREIWYALQLQKERGSEARPFIRPEMLCDPATAPPPPELRHLHFDDPQLYSLQPKEGPSKK